MDLGVDWRRFLEIARFHRIEGLAWHALSPLELPDSVLSQLREAADAIAGASLRASLECMDLRHRFECAGLPVLFLKGLTLGELAYGNPALKAAVDIDLLIDPGDLDYAAAILRSGGYKLVAPPASVSDATLRSWHRDWKESVWAKGDRSLQLDLHTRTSDNPALIPDIDVHSSTQEVDVGNGVRLPTLASDELVAYLAVHGASSAWFRLKWASDFAALIDGFTGGELERLYARTLELGAGRAAGQAFLLADRLFGSLADCAALRADLLKDRWIRRLVAVALRLLIRQPVEPTASRSGTLPIHQAQFWLLPGFGHRMTELSGQARRFYWRGRLWAGLARQSRRGV